MRTTTHALVLAGLLAIPVAGYAQAPTPAAPAAATAAPAVPGAAPAGDPVVARAGSGEIHYSDVMEGAKSLPEQARQMPPDTVFSMLTDRLVNTLAVAEEARKQGLDKDPATQRELARANEQILANALFAKLVGPTLTEDAIKAVYQSDYAGKPGPEEVHARHILVADEAQAKDIIAKLKAGADFAKTAATYSTEPGAKERGGDLGFFKADDMVPAFAQAAFAMQPGEISKTPVHTEFGWHVIKVEERRTAPAPTLEQVHDQIREQLVNKGVKLVLDQAVADFKIEKFNMDGTPPRATDNLVPPGK